MIHTKKDRKMKLILSGFLTAALAVCCIGETWIPRDMTLPEHTTLLPRDQVEVQMPSGKQFKPSNLIRTTSLAGEWKFSGLESSETPFPATAREDSDFAAPDFDDSDWKMIRVPLNWYRNPATSYEKVLKYTAASDLKAGATIQRLSNPFFKGCYRHSIDLPNPLPPGRILLRFEGVAYEAELFVNGQKAAGHHGSFTSWTPDITPYVKSGKNLIALRVFFDIAPIGNVTHTYGTLWGATNMNGGIWLPVSMIFAPESLITDLRITTREVEKGTLRIDYTVTDPGGRPLSLTPGVAVTPAGEKAAPSPASEFPAITLENGTYSGTLEIQVDHPKLWSPDSPNLYYCTLYFRCGNTVTAVRLERFGFRDFRATDTGFTLNGKPITLFMESAHSLNFGGYPTKDGHCARPRERFEEFRRKGYNILRTAHHPVGQDVLDAADETGMMIYDEWGFAFIEQIDEKKFEENNLPELKQFVLQDYNHASVVMWSLGNEVEHRRDPALVRQLRKQIALVRELDLQKRPISAFAGVGNLLNYGNAEFDTDVIDYHLYVGITKPWTQWNRDFQRLYDDCARLYGNGKTLNKPIVISECIGGGWGLQPDPEFKLGNVEEYIAILKKPYSFGNPGAAGYSGAVGIASALDPKRCWRHTQRYLGSRIVDLIRQDERISGFSPWISFPTPVSTQWTQKIYAGLRRDAKDGLMVRQLLTPGTLPLEAFIRNQSSGTLKNIRLHIELKSGEKLQTIADLSFPELPVEKLTVQRFSLALPETGYGSGEIRLTVCDGDREIGRNFYPVTLHPETEAAKPVEGAAKIALLARSAGLEKVLNDLNIPYRFISGTETLNGFRCAVIPPGTNPTTVTGTQMRRWVEGGGRLLILEQTPGSIPGFPEYQIEGDSNSLIEVVVLKHPVFSGLAQSDFDVWAENPFGNLVTAVANPLNRTALAVKGAFLDSRKCGAAIAEATVGRGHVLFSQLMATDLWKKNGAATRYLRNVMEYMTSLAPQSAPVLDVPPLNFVIIQERALLLDLSKQVNRGFRDEKAGDGIGGWTDQGSNDFQQMPSGELVAAGIPFRIIDPETNSGNGCIALRGKPCPAYPAEALGIPVNAKVTAFYFLHTLGYGSAGLAGIYRINYADGSCADYKLEGGVNIGDWWGPARLPEAVPGIVRTNAYGSEIGLYVSRWINPRPDVEVKSIDCLAVSESPSIPLLVAVTAERASDSPLTLIGSGCRELHGSAGKKMVATGNRAIGQWCAQIELPASDDKTTPGAMFFLFPDWEKLKTEQYHYLTFDLRSGSVGLIDLVIPEANWRSGLIVSQELGVSQGKWVKVRLRLDHDFKFTGKEFPLSGMRPELWFYNGKNKAVGFPRRAVSFQITNIRFE